MLVGGPAPAPKQASSVRTLARASAGIFQSTPYRHGPTLSGTLRLPSSRPASRRGRQDEGDKPEAKRQSREPGAADREPDGLRLCGTTAICSPDLNVRSWPTGIGRCRGARRLVQNASALLWRAQSAAYVQSTRTWNSAGRGQRGWASVLGGNSLLIRRHLCDGSRERSGGCKLRSSCRSRIGGRSPLGPRRRRFWASVALCDRCGLAGSSRLPGFQAFFAFVGCGGSSGPAPQWGAPLSAPGRGPRLCDVLVGSCQISPSTSPSSSHPVRGLTLASTLQGSTVDIVGMHPLVHTALDNTFSPSR